ncbi:hypothetical protein NCCP2716_17140 [Sporosarcina sp. NCCP-2716]|uniref:S-layer homology domain-containing protein n=1 Tax=Sporosarcina sp. NCCP-2716 TaxID=2943679 RepID=UPI00203B6AF8|nr:S-layer homology domain-containing protein [Sporosarcina sp. NCCP-2716]GKV69216.1 hypothetical protein NCCP2716_17140 [Sporosarcina sp. NCCP-2716]
MAQQSYKKFVATAATASLVASALVPVASANVTTSAFTDVPASYQKAVDFVVTNNISAGLTPTQYGISQQIKRVDAAAMIAAAAGLNDPKAPASGFTDVPDRAAVAVNSLKAAGVVSGKTATKFGAQDNITRGEAALMLQKAFDLKAGDTKNSFTDVSSRYDSAVDALVANNVTNGINKTQFGTQNNIKRGDFAKFLYALEDQIVVPGAAVETVTVVNETTTTVKLKDADKDLTTKDFKITVNGDVVAPTEVKSNGTGEIYTITHASLKGLKGNVAVNGVIGSFDFTVEKAAKVQSISALNAKEITVVFDKNLTDEDADSMKQIVVVAPSGQEIVANAVTGPKKGDNSATYAFTNELSETGTYTVKGTEVSAKYETAIVGLDTKLNSDNSVTVSGNTVLADRVEVSFDGTNFVDASLKTDGTFTYTSPVQSAGSKTVTVRATKGTSIVTRTTTVNVPTPAQAAVTTAVAKNPREIEVKFSQAVEDSSAENVSNYTLKVNNVAVTAEKATQVDDNTVILTLPSTLSNNDTYQVEKVANVLTEGTFQKMAEYKGEAKIFNNTTGPKLLKVAKKADDSLVLTFDKHVNPASASVKIDNVTLTGTKTAAAYDDAGNYTLTFAKDSNAPASIYGAGTHTVVVNNATDLSGVGTTVQQSTFVIGVDNTPPTVKSIKPVGSYTFDVEFSEPIANAPTNLSGLIANGNLKVKLGNVDYTNLGGVASSAKIDSTTYRVVLDKEVTVSGTPNTTYSIYDANKTTSVVTVELKGYEDAAGLIGKATTQSITLTKDTVKPTIKATNLNTYNSATKTFNVKFSEALNTTNFDASKVAVYDQNNVRLNLAGAPVAITGDTVSITLDASSTPTSAQQFKVVFDAGAVVDLSDNKNDALTTYVDNRQAATPVQPAIASVTTAKNVITVTYNDKMSDSAITAANYKLDAGALPQGTKLDFTDSGKTTVQITLPENTYNVNTTGTLELSKSIVSADGSKYVATVSGGNVTSPIVLSDNIKPVLTGAKWVAESTDTTSATIELTFSEAVKTPANSDFVVLIGGAEYTVAASPVVQTDAKKVRITLANGAVNVNNTVQVKVTDDQSITIGTEDLAVRGDGTTADGNKLTRGTTVTVSGKVAP